MLQLWLIAPPRSQAWLYSSPLQFYPSADLHTRHQLMVRDPCALQDPSWGLGCCQVLLVHSNEAASSRDRQDKRLPPSEKTVSPERRLSPHRTCCAQRRSSAEQVGWESQTSFRQKCKKAAGGEKRKDKVKSSSRQTLPSPEESTSTDIAVESATQKILLSRATRHVKIQTLVYMLPQVP